MNSALRMLIPAKARKWVFIGGAVLILLVFLLGFLRGKEGAFAAILIGVVCIAVLFGLWLLIAFLMRGKRRKAQREFDAGMAAREGIEDRKREWKSWVAELEKNDIDRYELPFYLLVGEPQSGKSVLLQNSDLKFLFGQSRLSGIGGTRGCDWWFTEEAVILDLAGRLFTHEGGAADEAEWEAFLDLLNGFRPLDPANGIMLVIPCDGLLEDSLETCAHKASKAREALLSLTRKLEAKLPIYVVLTKADKIFGFAETVHRLPIEQRHQMFGWSRTAERLEQPYEPTELREAWDSILQRSTLLRDRMLGSARLPEAQPEVDRLLGFPEELKGLYEPLEAYLQRVFLDSDLVEQLYFRGVYLTSGLQSGAPIAKVCLDILDRPGEADNRDLEKLFIRQHAYFIKDLVRKRVFGERGLVKPTSSRVERAQKKAWVGYGLAASIAVISLIWGAIEIRRYYYDVGQDTYDAALDAAEELTPSSLATLAAQDTEQPTLDYLLDRLGSIRKGRDRNATFMQTLHNSRQPHLQTLYAAAYDDVFRTRLQSLAALELKRRSESYDPAERDARPQDYRAFMREVRAAEVLVEGFADSDGARRLATILDGAPMADRVEAEHDLRGEGFEPETGAARATVTPVLAKLNSLWDRTLDPLDPIRVEDSLRFCLAWEGMTRFDTRVREMNRQLEAGQAPDSRIHAACAEAVQILEDLEEADNDPGFEVESAPVAAIQRPEHPLVDMRSRLLAATGETETKWSAHDRFVKFLEDNGLGALKLAGAGSLVVPKADLQGAYDYLGADDLAVVIQPEWLGPERATDLDGAAAWAKNGTAMLAKHTEGTVHAIANVKLALFRDAFLTSFGTWDELHAAVHPDVDPTSDASGELARRIATQNVALRLYRELGSVTEDLKPMLDRAEALAKGGVEKVAATLPQDALSSSGIAVLQSTRTTIPTAADDCEAKLRQHLASVRQTLVSGWGPVDVTGSSDVTAADASTIASQARSHLSNVDAEFASDLLPLVDGEREAWKSAVRARLDPRLAAYRSKVDQAITAKADLSDVRTLKGAFDRITEEVIGGSTHERLDEWTDGLYARLGVADPFDTDIGYFYADRTMDERRSLLDYQSVAQLGTWSEAESPPRRLRTYVVSFLNTRGDAVAKGAALAQAMGRDSLVFLPVADTDPQKQGIHLKLCRLLGEQFNAIALTQLRADYQDELADLVTEEYRESVDVFWHDRSTPTTDKSRHATAVAGLFGDAGVYLALLDSYRVFDDLERDFRLGYDDIEGEASTLSDLEKNRWKVDVFLESMLLYVRGAKELADLERENRAAFPLAELKAYEIALRSYAPTQEEFEATWNHWDAFRSDLFTEGGIVSIQFDDQGPLGGERKKVGWGFEKPRRFDLSWRDRVGGGGAWDPYERNSSLEPVLLFWSDPETHARGRNRPQKREAEVRFEVTTDEFAPFKLELTPPPPRRPDIDLGILRSR